MLLSDLTRTINAIRQMPTARRAAEVRKLLPDLRALAGNELVRHETKINTLTKAARLMVPTAARLDTVGRALRQVEAALCQVEQAAAVRNVT